MSDWTVRHYNIIRDRLATVRDKATADRLLDAMEYLMRRIRRNAGA